MAGDYQPWSAFNYVVGNPVALTDPTGAYPEGWSESNVWLANNTGLFGSGGETYDDFFGVESVNIALFPSGSSNKEYVQDKKVFSSAGITTLSVSNANDAYKQIKKVLGDSKKLGNLIIVSHGAKSEAWFQIGNIDYHTPRGTRNAKSLNKLSGLFGDNGSCTILSCHGGSSINGGRELSLAVAENLGVPVYASLSWTSSRSSWPSWGGYGLKARDRSVSPSSSKYARYAHDHVGDWIKVFPSGYITSIQNVSISRSGNIRYIGKTVIRN